ncbi:MAG: hypothetical protein Q9185_002727 [Variospora sp. 1 TL-2023]
MSLIGGAVSESSSSSPLHSAQARDESNGSGGQIISSDDELAENPFHGDNAESASSLGQRLPPSAQAPREHNGSSLEAEAAPPSVHDELNEDSFDEGSTASSSPLSRQSLSSMKVTTEHNEPSSSAEEGNPSFVKKPSPLRPNKHLGSHATWRDRTASERQIATSLDQLRAQDLSAHLYNFYSLKRRVIEPEKWNDEGREDDDELPGSSKRWVSSKNWTAWPLPPHLVPRETDANPWDTNAGQEAFARKDKRTSSHELLQEILTAVACKKAKERFYEREWEDSGAESPPTPTDPWLKRQSQIQDMLHGFVRPDEDEPVVLVDDERAKSILRPSLNHILAKLDTLLAGLHDARSSYTTSKRSFIQVQTTTEDESSTDSKRKRKASHTRVSQERSRRRKASPHSTEDSSAVSSEPEDNRGRHSGPIRGSARPLHRSRSRITQSGLRDWSDVLGVASMCGWDAGVVDRAATRSSALFEESFVLRTLYEGQAGYYDTKYLPKASTSGGLREPAIGTQHAQDHRDNAGSRTVSHGPDLSEDNHDGIYGGVHVDGFLQTIPMHKSWTRQRGKRRKK